MLTGAENLADYRTQSGRCVHDDNVTAFARNLQQIAQQICLRHAPEIISMGR
ncbi:hypothetical protein D3C83_219150 [compost metagenome]